MKKKILSALALACLAGLQVAQASPNMYGAEGDVRLFSARTQGNGKLTFGIHNMISNDAGRLIGNQMEVWTKNGTVADPVSGLPVQQWKATGNKIPLIGDLTSLQSRANMGFGLGNYFDFGLSVPFNVDNGTFDEASKAFAPLETQKMGNFVMGDPSFWMILQYPTWPHSHVFDMAFMAQATAPLGSNQAGLLPRELAYYPSEDTVLNGVNQGYAYTTPNRQPLVKALMLWTLDFTEMQGYDKPVGLAFNVNYGLQAIPKAVAENEFILGASAKLKGEFWDIFAEYYGEARFGKYNSGFNVGAEPNYMNYGFTVKSADDRRAAGSRLGYFLKASYQVLMSDTTRMNVRTNNAEDDEYQLRYQIKHAGEPTFHVQLGGYYRMRQDMDEDGVDDDMDKCPRDKGYERYLGCQSPDDDVDGVCDAWVTERNLLSEYASECKGKDECPTKKGSPDYFGCTLPDADADGVCDPWVAEKGLLDQFITTCKAVDKCPEVAGFVKNDGCPVPDGDQDGVCDEWVQQTGLADKFAYICKGVDRCPKVKGKNEYMGCSEPDRDRDGVCDAWVTEVGMLADFKECSGSDVCPEIAGESTYFGCKAPDTDGDKFCDAWVAESGKLSGFKGVCDGVDKCPTHPGSSEGCPEGDDDKDGVCNPNIAENGLLPQFAGVCKGSDKCDQIPGQVEFDGCPVPDVDKDGTCDSWVAEKGLGAKLATICTGSDLCPNEFGAREKNGCPTEDTDKDGVCDAWVTEKGLIGKMTGICAGSDLCPMDKGAADNSGCPAADQDKDGVCDAWVSEKGMAAQFASTCTALDKCPLDKGELSEAGCPKPVQLAPKAKITLNGVNFASGKADLLNSSYGSLQPVIAGLIDNPEVVVEIHGHTDNVGKAKANEKLSLARAQSVANYMIAVGVKPSQIGAVRGFGPSKPVANNKTAEGKVKNRRIEMIRVK